MAEVLKIQINFSNAFAEKNASLPLFLRQSGIQGSVVVDHRENTHIDKVKIVLRGTLFNTIKHKCDQRHAPPKMQLKQKIFKMVDVQRSATAVNASDRGGSEQFDFDFQISKASYDLGSDSEDEDGFSSGFAAALPCSLGAFGPWCPIAAGQAPCKAEGLVKYELEASVYQGDEKVKSKHQLLRIYDCPDSHPPPVHMAHFPDDFTCSQEQRLRSMYRFGSSALAISVAEPKAVEIRPDGETALAAFVLHFTMRNHSLMPRNLDVCANSLLKALTFISAQKLDSQPTAKSAHTNPLLAAVPSWGRGYHRKFCVSQWTRGSIAGEWNATALLWMPLSESSTPAPSFFTPYLARRYSVTLRLEVKGEGKAVFNLHVPVQIVYPEGEMNVPSYESVVSTPESEEDEFDFGFVDELPIYVR